MDFTFSLSKSRTMTFESRTEVTTNGLCVETMNWAWGKASKSPGNNDRWSPWMEVVFGFVHQYGEC